MMSTLWARVESTLPAWMRKKSATTRHKSIIAMKRAAQAPQQCNQQARQQGYGALKLACWLENARLAVARAHPVGAAATPWPRMSAMRSFRLRRSDRTGVDGGDRTLGWAASGDDADVLHREQIHGAGEGVHQCAELLDDVGRQAVAAPLLQDADGPRQLSNSACAWPRMPAASALASSIIFCRAAWAGTSVLAWNWAFTISICCFRPRSGHTRRQPPTRRCGWLPARRWRGAALPLLGGLDLGLGFDFLPLVLQRPDRHLRPPLFFLFLSGQRATALA